MGYVRKSVGYVGKSVGYAAITHTFQPMKSIRSDVPWYKYVYIYLFYTSYSYNSISRYAYCGISAHIPWRDLVIFCVLRSH